MTETDCCSRNDFRHRVDTFLDSLITRFYQEVPYAQHLLTSTDINVEYLKRHTIEIILRLRLKRSIDALTIHYFTKRDPKLAKLWSSYTEDEMLHDALFAKDLEALGVSKQEIYGTEPLFATKLLQGYFYYGLEHEERPLASLCSSYFIEYTSQKTQPQWLENVARSLKKEVVAGATAHAKHDLDDDHTDMVWNVLSTFVKTAEDEAKVLDHIENIYLLFAMFFTEMHQKLVKKTDRLSTAESAMVA